MVVEANSGRGGDDRTATDLNVGQSKVGATNCFKARSVVFSPHRLQPVRWSKMWRRGGLPTDATPSVRAINHGGNGLGALGLKSPKPLGEQCLAAYKPPVWSPGT
ncbi:hypothetical protein LguiA_032919 [Lonicera macranthoides]